MECHPREARLFEGSDHDLALQVARPGTVLGDFEGTELRVGASVARFSRRGDRYFVRTDDAEGLPRELPVEWTFGVDPLQQYLVPFDGGRLQALTTAWDARPAAEGGQRWFDLFAGVAPDPARVLHWTGPAMNWNRMCAECHSTGLRKNWDDEGERYATTWSEEDVSCEACHGRGSAHVTWARGRAHGLIVDDPTMGLEVRIGDGTPGAWVLREGRTTAELAMPRELRPQIEVCARCHAHRARIADDELGTPVAESHVVSLLEENLYHANGTIEDEVYEYGSFLQSRMFAQGVVCTDCHDPHSGRRRLAEDDVCARCHRPEVYAVRAHHRHDPARPGARCVECHMPLRTYMGVDGRRDHAFRVPRPDLSERLGTPNACNDCHADRSATWSANAIREWTGEDPAATSHWAEAIAAGRAWARGGGEALRRVITDPQTPPIVRATAVTLLPRYAAEWLPLELERAAHDGDPLVRRAAATSLAALEAGDRARIGRLLVQDPVRTVRLAAVPALAELPRAERRARLGQPLEQVIEEYRDAQAFVSDGPEAWVNLGNLERALGRNHAAGEAYRRALHRQPSFAPAAVNLADLLREAGRETDAEMTLREALARVPEAADAWHALGLALVRQRRLPEAVEALRRAVELAPREPRYAWVLGVALTETGDPEGARRVLLDAARRFPAYPPLAEAVRGEDGGSRYR